MPDTSDTALRQFDSFNHWLSDAYGENTTFDTLLIREGLHETEIELLKRDHLCAFLQAVVDLLDSYKDLDNNPRYQVMLQHYGLLDGKPLAFWEIGHNVGVAGERIRQLTKRRLDLYRDPERQAVLQHDLAAIARQLLDNERSSQGG